MKKLRALPKEIPPDLGLRAHAPDAASDAMFLQQYMLHCYQLILSGKWKLSIVHHLQQGPLRFGELQRALPGISEKMLSQDLRSLEQDFLVQRTVFPEVPPRVEYQLAPHGKALAPLFQVLLHWSVQYMACPNSPLDEDIKQQLTGSLGRRIASGQ